MVAVMVLLIATLMGAWFMFTTSEQVKLSSAVRRGTRAMDVAEAGVEEAIQRIGNGDVPSDASNPRAVSLIYNTAAGSIPVSGADTTSLATAQSLGSALPYTTAAKSSNLLTIRWKTTPDGSTVMRYSATHNPQVNTSVGSPIYQITSTGTLGSATQAVQAEVCRQTAHAVVLGAFMANVGIDFIGNISICGRDHSMNTPVGTRTPDCNVGIGNWLATTSPGSDVYGAWSGGAISMGGSSDLDGFPTDTTSHQTGFFAGPWEAVGMTQADFWNWIGSPVSAEPNPANGAVYLDNNTVKQDQSGNFAYHGGSGTGMLYVDGDMTINGNFNYTGIIYVEGNLKINGTCWILGAVVVKGKTTVKLANGNATVLYSSEAIANALANASNKVTRISWRQLPK